LATSWSAISAITRSIDWRQSDDPAKNETGIDVVGTLNKSRERNLVFFVKDYKNRKTDVLGGKSGRS
jgi:hypothetical protein